MLFIKKYFIIVKICILLTIVCQSLSELVIRNLHVNNSLKFVDVEATFGPEISKNIPTGFIVIASPLDACSSVNPPPNNISLDLIEFAYFALIERGNCSFVSKVEMVQNSSYLGAIVVNFDDTVFPMNADKIIDIKIPSIMIGKSSGDKIMRSFTYTSGYYAEMHPNPNTVVRFYIIPILIIISTLFIVIVIIIIVRNIINWIKSPKKRLSSRELKKIKVFLLSDDNRNGYETCPICLDEYVLRDRLRVLPCQHSFHAKCVDKWLLKNQRSCPVCKYWIGEIRPSTMCGPDESAPAPDDHSTCHHEESSIQRTRSISSLCFYEESPELPRHRPMSADRVMARPCSDSWIREPSQHERQSELLSTNDQLPLLVDAHTSPPWLEQRIDLSHRSYGKRRRGRKRVWLTYDNSAQSLDAQRHDNPTSIVFVEASTDPTEVMGQESSPKEFLIV